NEGLAEMPAPHAIHDDASCQGTTLAEDVLGEFQATGTLLERGIALAKDGEKLARRQLSGSCHVAMKQDVHVVSDTGLDVDGGEIGSAAVNPDAGVENGLCEREIGGAGTTSTSRGGCCGCRPGGGRCGWWRGGWGRGCGLDARRLHQAIEVRIHFGMA